MNPRLSILILALSLPGLVPAQTVYESKGGQGKVYSDRPVPGAKPIELRPLNVAEPIPVPPPAAERARDPDGQRPAAPSPSYQSLRVVFPEEGGSVAANDATFEVRLAVDPPLRVDKGHAFALRLDGRPVPGRFTATEIMLPPEFFGEIPPTGTQRHMLEASIIDAGGQTVLTAPPVAFQTRFVTVLQRSHGGRPRPVPQLPPAQPKPPPPAIEPAVPRTDGRRVDR